MAVRLDVRFGSATCKGASSPCRISFRARQCLALFLFRDVELLADLPGFEKRRKGAEIPRLVANASGHDRRMHTDTLGERDDFRIARAGFQPGIGPNVSWDQRLFGLLVRFAFANVFVSRRRVAKAEVVDEGLDFAVEVASDMASSCRSENRKLSMRS